MSIDVDAINRLSTHWIMRSKCPFVTINEFTVKIAYRRKMPANWPLRSILFVFFLPSFLSCSNTKIGVFMRQHSTVANDVVFAHGLCSCQRSMKKTCWHIHDFANKMLVVRLNLILRNRKPNRYAVAWKSNEQKKITANNDFVYCFHVIISCMLICSQSHISSYFDSVCCSASCFFSMLFALCIFSRPSTLWCL